MKKTLLISFIVSLSALLMAQLSEPFNTYINNLPTLSTPNNQYQNGDFVYVLRNGASAKFAGNFLRNPVIDGLTCGGTVNCQPTISNNVGGSNSFGVSGAGAGLGLFQIINGGRPSSQITFPNTPGLTGQYLRSAGGGNSSQTYDYPTGQGNIVGRFGSMDVCQRGAGAACSFAVPASTVQYTLDGCYIATGANEAHTVSSAAGLSTTVVSGQNIVGSNRSASIQRNAGQTGTTFITYGCPLDLDESALTQGNFVALSFVWSTGANFSGTAFNFQYVCGTGAPIKFNSGYTGLTTVASGVLSTPASSPITRSQVTSTITAPLNCAQAEVVFTWVPNGTAGAADTINIDSVALEIVSSATSIASPFQGLDFATQLKLAQRHYQKTFKYSTAPVQNAGIQTGEIQTIAGVAGAATDWVSWRFQTKLRLAAAYSVTLYNPAAANAQIRDEQGGTDLSATAVNTATDDVITIAGTGNAGTVVGNLLGLHIAVDAGI